MKSAYRMKAQGLAKGGSVHSDAKQDKALIKDAIRKAMAKDRREDEAMYVKKGESSGSRLDRMRRGGKIKAKDRAKSKKNDAVKISIINAPVSKESDKSVAPSRPMPPVMPQQSAPRPMPPMGAGAGTGGLASVPNPMLQRGAMQKRGGRCS